MKARSAQRVLVVGMGGLGCPASLALAQEGIGSVTLMDGDRVEISNLHRQPWHHDGDVGRLKVESASEKLKAAFPQLKVEWTPEHLDASNAPGALGAHDWVVDATDSVRAKFLLSDLAVRIGVPLVYAGVVRDQGQAMLIRRGGPCLRCLFETPPDERALPTCAAAGVLGSLAGVMGFLQVRLALHELMHPPDGSATWVRMDGARLESHRGTVHQRPDCPACSTSEGERLQAQG